MSDELQKSLAFRFMRWRLGITGYDEATERQLEAKLIETVEQTTKLDAAVVLAFDAVHDGDGRRDDPNTHLYVTNDYVIDLAKRHRKVLFGASVHPYRTDAIAELERCVKAGAVLLKWLPITQNFNPADERCFAFYEALAHHRLTLLSHTGGEKSLPTLDASVASPRLLEPALKRGVMVIAAHCGTRSTPGETDYVDDFMAMAREYENLYGDTSALCLPTRSYAFARLMKHPVVREKLVHGSDWPIIALPRVTSVGIRNAFKAMREKNWMRRDVMIKEQLGFDDAYWQRAARIVGVTSAVS
jgi:predicted TIM-barrel fold metal-dependent hydrolase